MKTRFLPILFVVLLLSAATSEARSQRHGRRPSEIALGAANDDGGGPLARSRGLSQAESTAVGTVLAEIASSHAAAADAAAANIPARRLSPDYYRAYAHRTQATGAKQRVAVKPAATKPPVLAAVPPVPAPPPVVVAKPTVVAAKRVAVAPPVIKAPKVIPPPVVAVKAPVAVRQRVAVAPSPTETRMAFAPRTVAAKVPPPVPQANAVTPVRAVFGN